MIKRMKAGMPIVSIIVTILVAITSVTSTIYGNQIPLAKAILPPSPPVSRALPHSSGNIYLAWISNDTGHSNVLFAKSTDAGITFKTLYILSSPNIGKTADFGTNIGASGSNIYVYWWTNKTGKFEPVFRASHDNGNTFGNIIKLNSTSGGVSK